MPRRNYPKRSEQRQEHFASDVCSIPGRPEIATLIVVPLKMVYHNTAAAPWATEAHIIHKFDDRLLELIRGWK